MNRLPFGEEERRRLEEWSREYDPSRRTNKKGESGNLALLCRCVCGNLPVRVFFDDAFPKLPVRKEMFFGDDRRPDNSVQELFLMPFLMLVSKLSRFFLLAMLLLLLVVPKLLLSLYSMLLLNMRSYQHY